MPFVKLDCGILNSTLWFEREAREVFITALLMAEPYESTEPMAQIAVDSLDETGWVVPPGWYGFVPAAGVGILMRARVDEVAGREALRRLGNPEASSRSPDFEGRRLVRVDGGYLVLNYMKYRERDYTAALRSARYRQRKAQKAAESSRRNNDTLHRDITQAEGEGKKKKGKKDKSASVSSSASHVNGTTDEELAMRAGAFCERYGELYSQHRRGARYLPRPALDYTKAVELCAVWDNERLERLATVFLKTDHDFAASGSRTIGQFAALASWCDDRLREVEAGV